MPAWATRRSLAAGGVLGPAAFVAAWAVLGTRLDGYDPLDDAISRLAAVGAPDRGAMTLGFVAFGTGVPLYALALRDELPGKAWLSAAATGLAILGVAAFPLDGPAGDGVHGLFAGLGYATLAATPLLAAGPLRRLGHSRWARWSLVCGSVSTVCLAATVADLASGLFQRAGLTVGDAWIVASAVTILRGGVSRPHGAA